MNPLPPLPLIDGVIFMDNSGWLESIQLCHRLTQYKGLNKRISAGEKAALNFGSVTHLGLEYRYKVYQNKFLDEQYYRHVADMYSTFFEQHPPPADDPRNLNWALTVIRKHNEKYEMEEFNLLSKDGQPLVELPFSIPIHVYKSGAIYDTLTPKEKADYERLGGIVVVYTGRIDLPVMYDGQVYVMDHKTTGMLGKQFFERMKMSAQQKGYCWSFEQITGLKVAGYIVNAIRTKEPPLYVQRNEKSGSMTPDKWWAESLQRERYIMQPGMTDEWLRNARSLINEFFWAYESGYMAMKTTQCTQFGRCQYFDVCSMVEEDRPAMLASGMYQDNTWSPLHEPSQPKAA